MYNVGVPVRMFGLLAKRAPPCMREGAGSGHQGMNNQSSPLRILFSLPQKKKSCCLLMQKQGYQPCGVVLCPDPTPLTRKMVRWTESWTSVCIFATSWTQWGLGISGLNILWFHQPQEVLVSSCKANTAMLWVGVTSLLGLPTVQFLITCSIADLATRLLW